MEEELASVAAELRHSKHSISFDGQVSRLNSNSNWLLALAWLEGTDGTTSIFPDYSFSRCNSCGFFLHGALEPCRQAALLEIAWSVHGEPLHFRKPLLQFSFERSLTMMGWSNPLGHTFPNMMG